MWIRRIVEGAGAAGAAQETLSRSSSFAKATPPMLRADRPPHLEIPMSIGSIGGVKIAWPAQQSSSAQSPSQDAQVNGASGAAHHHHHRGGGGGGVESLLATGDTSSTDATDDPLGPSAATPTTDDSGLPFTDQLSSASLLLSALTDPSASQDSTSTLANLAGESDIWQGINTTG